MHAPQADAIQHPFSTLPTESHHSQQKHFHPKILIATPENVCLMYSYLDIIPQVEKASISLTTNNKSDSTPTTPVSPMTEQQRLAYEAAKLVCSRNNPGACEMCSG
jgi:hypothetical protein